MSFFPRNKGTDSAEKLSSSSSVTEDKPSSSSCSKNRRIDSMIVSNDTIKAEIMCVLKMVISNFSMNSGQDISNLFAERFTRPIADAFNLNPTKCRYLIFYGLAPYFHQFFIKELDNLIFIATSFNECYNRVNQKEQNGFTCKILEWYLPSNHR